jgi:raffinose/stachyose/melibiose transport system substrate-binding protein
MFLSLKVVISRRWTAGVALVCAAVAAALTASIGAAHPNDVTLSVWEPTALNAQLADLVNGFTAATGVQVDVRTLPDPFEDTVLTKFATGSRPDIIWYQSVAPLLAKLNPPKNLQDLSGMAFNKNYISKRTAAGGIYTNGRRYAVPVDYPSVFATYYSKSVFKKYHLAVPRSGLDLLAICQKLKGTGVTPIYLAEGEKWPPSVLFWNLWGDVAASDSQIAALNAGKAHLYDKPFLKTAKLIVTLEKAGCFEKNLFTSSYVDQQKAVMTGRAAIMSNGSWTLPSLLSLGYTGAQIDAKLGFLPLSLNGQFVSFGPPAGFVAPKTGDAAHEAVARQFIAYITSNGYSQYLTAAKGLPIFRGYQTPAGTSRLLLAMDTKAQKNGVPYLGARLAADFTGNWTTYIGELLNGQRTPYSYCQQLDKEYRINARLLGLPGF